MPVAIVTASDSGIGKATAVALARDGFDVGVTWHSDEEGAQSTAEEVRSHGRRAEVRQLDLAQLPGAADVIDELIDALGGVDVLVNNSGTSRRAAFLELGFDDWRQTLGVDLDGAFLCAQRAARRMVDQGRGGRIVNVTSVHEHVPLPESVAYVAAKHGLLGITKVVALETAGTPITCNAICPGWVLTPLVQRQIEARAAAEGIAVEQAGTAMLREKQPMLAFTTPEKIAALAVFLCGEAASTITGAALSIDGGWVAQ